MTNIEKKYLLNLSRKSLKDFFDGKRVNGILKNLVDVPIILKQIGATFVTLTKKGQLRGCIGKLMASNPIYVDVVENSYSAAFNDYRFEPLTEEELDQIKIEISVLTPMKEYIYANNKQLLEFLSKSKPGVYITTNQNTATYLPQVWDDLPEATLFLSSLCEKAGLESGFWRNNKLKVFTYKVENFNE